MSEPDDAGYAAWWLQLALGDLATAAAVLVEPEVPARSAAGLAQQAAEKALKGFSPPGFKGATII